MPAKFQNQMNTLGALAWQRSYDTRRILNRNSEPDEPWYTGKFTYTWMPEQCDHVMKWKRFSHC